MRGYALVLVLCAVVLSVAVPADVAANDKSRGLTDAEQAYVKRMDSAYFRAAAVLGALEREFEQQFDYWYETGPGYTDSPAVVLPPEQPFDPWRASQFVLAARAELAQVAQDFRQPPPSSMQGLVPTHSNIAVNLDRAFAATLAALDEEGKMAALHAGSHWLSGLVGAEAPIEQPRLSLIVRVVAAFEADMTNLGQMLVDGQAELHERAREVPKERADSLLKALFGLDCFIATAAYGTNTAAEIDVLRDFRDDVLLRSSAGRDYVGFYYAASPPLADFVRNHEWLRTIVREGIVDPVVRAVTVLQPLWLPG